MVEISRIICKISDSYIRQVVYEDFKKMLSESNPNFDKVKFGIACKMLPKCLGKVNS
jgi:hypothetical protein